MPKGIHSVDLLPQEDLFQGLCNLAQPTPYLYCRGRSLCLPVVSFSNTWRGTGTPPYSVWWDLSAKLTVMVRLGNRTYHSECKRRNELRDYKRVFLKLTVMVRLGNRTYRSV